MYPEAKKCWSLIRLCGKYLCLKYEKMPEDVRVKIWDNVRRITTQNEKCLCNEMDGVPMTKLPFEK